MFRPPPISPLFPSTPLSRSPCAGSSASGSAPATWCSARRNSPPDFLRDADAAACKSPRQSSVKERSEEHTSELQSHLNLVCRLLLAKKKEIDDQEHRYRGVT